MIPRFAPAAAAVLLGLLLVAPVVAVGIVGRDAIEGELAQQATAERVRTVRLGAAFLARPIDNAGLQLSVFAARPAPRAAFARRSAADLEPLLAELRALNPEWDTVTAVDAAGRLFARAPRSEQALDLDVSDRDYFKAALASPEPYAGQVVLSRISGQTVATIAVGLREGDRLLGVVVASIRPQTILERLQPIDGTAGREMVVVDGSSKVIASTDSRREPLSTVTWPGLVEARAGRSGSLTGELEGTPRVTTCAAIGTSQWVLCFLDDSAVALAAERQLESRFVAAASLGILAALIVTGVLLLLYRHLVRQRRALVVAAAEQQDLLLSADQANRHKSEFLASMSHELRTPLNAILGFSQLLDEQLAKALSDRQRRYLRNIHDAGAHLLALINDVLDLSKVEAGRIELRIERSTIHAAVDPTISAARAAADERGVRLDASVENATVDLDVGRLRQVLYNLLSNAVKFTPSGGRVGARVWTDGSDLHLEIADSGIGIPEDRQDRVFGAFERVNEDRSESSGTGLGLALTKQLVEVQNGSIAFESAEGRGTTFRVILPGVVSTPVLGERVLIVEDDPRDAELALAITATVGLRAEHASTVAAALDAARRSPPLAVLLDLRLAKERGETVLSELRACATTREIPIAIVSVEDDDGASRALGADEHFTKPVDRRRLSDWLRDVAAGASKASAA